MAVAALKACHHGGDGEGQQQNPDEDGDLRGFLQNSDKVPPPKMHHIEVAVEGQGDEEGDAGSSVEEQHEEHRLALPVFLAAPESVLVVVRFGREADHQQEIRHHDVEEEDAFVLPELEPKEEVSGTVLFSCATSAEQSLDKVSGSVESAVDRCSQLFCHKVMSHSSTLIFNLSVMQQTEFVFLNDLWASDRFCLFPNWPQFVNSTSA